MTTGSPIRPDEIAALREWLAAGMNVSQIAELLGRSHKSLYEIVQRLGLKSPNAADRKRIRRERIKLRLEHGHGHMPTGYNTHSDHAAMVERPAMPRAAVSALYAGRRYQDDLRAAQPEPLWRGPAPVRVYDGGMSSTGWAVM